MVSHLGTANFHCLIVISKSVFLTSVFPMLHSFTHSLNKYCTCARPRSSTGFEPKLLTSWSCSRYLPIDLSLFISRVGVNLRAPCAPHRVLWKSNAMMRGGAWHMQDESQLLFLRRMTLATSWGNTVISLQVSLRAGCLYLPSPAGMNPFPWGPDEGATHSGLQDPLAIAFFSPMKSGLCSKLGW